MIKLLSIQSDSVYLKRCLDLSNILSVQDYLLRRNYEVAAVKIDTIGSRVLTYHKLVPIANTVSKILAPLLTGYIQSRDKYKVLKCQPNEFQTEEKNMLSKALHSKSTEFQFYARFQSRVVHEWNLKSKDATAFIVPLVSLRDKIKNGWLWNGYD